MLRTLSGLSRGLLLVVVLAWLLFGVAWGALHWVIVPRIGEFRPQLEARASEALGVPVRVGAVTAQSTGMMPSFELSDVALFDAQGRVALSLPRVLVTLSPRSLWRLGFEQLYIDQPKLDIRRDANGRITMAGLDFSSPGGGNSDALNWFFSQIEFAIHDGAVRWTDESRGTEPVVLQHVDAVMRNLGRHHDFRIDATPPPTWGDRLSLRGRFLQPLLTRNPGRWQEWDGQMYAAFERVDLSELRRFVDLGFDLQQGRGAVRAWVDVSEAQVKGATADVALSEVGATLGRDLPSLSLKQVQGRFGARQLANGFEFLTQALVFDTADGLHWPGGNVRLVSMQAKDKVAAQGEITADRLDLAALAQIATHLPVDAIWRQKLMQFAPKGQMESLTASWQGEWTSPTRYAAQGRLLGLELSTTEPVPGVRGLDVDFDLTQKGGRASLSVTNGSVDVAGMFQDSRIDLDQLSASASWKVTGDQVAVEFDDVKFSNPDAQGQARIKWQTADASKSVTHSRFPGVLDLQASLSRVEGRRVHRYLPLVIGPQARNYVRDAVLDGTASNVRFVVKGDISDMPALHPRQGIFKVTADVSQARLAYVPASLQDPGEPAWPVLADLSGELLIDGMQLQVRRGRAKLGDDSTLQVTQVEASIADLMNPQVVVLGEIKGPLKEALRVVNGSPVADMIGQALTGSVASGAAEHKLKLVLPLAEMGQSTVQGSVTFAGNDLQVTPDTPKLSRARGVVNYSHVGFQLAGVQARLLGGDARLEGGWVLAPGDTTAVGLRAAPTSIRITGTASAEGLRQATELGFVSRLAQHFSGSTSYNAALGWRAGTSELLVSSALQGMASTLPAPLQKEPQSRLPMRLQTSLVNGEANGAHAIRGPLQDRLSLTLEGLAQVVYQRDVSKAEPRVLRGSISVGADTLDAPSLPDQGVHANINLPRFNADHWADVLAQISGVTHLPVSPSDGPTLETSYLPTTLAVRAQTLTFGARSFNQVVLGAHRDGQVWRGNVDATELNGYLEYRQPADASATGGGRVYARLARLTLAPNTANEVEALLDAQPASIPALDIVVDDFELRGKRLGRLEVEAVNRSAVVSGGMAAAREWRLNKLNLTVPEATLTTSGNWTRVNAQSQTVGPILPPSAADRRRTVMNFKLDVIDGGKLLARFGMPDVIRQGSGKIEGQVAWLGSPLKLDYPTLGGAFAVNVASGQFLKADPGIAKLLGVLSLQALPRRLTLDFRDVFSEGFSFDFLRGDVTVDKGLARTNNLQMKGVNAAVLMDGTADIANETQDIQVIVVPEINAGTASLIASVINPAVGLGSFLAQLFLRRPLIESATQEFHIDGSWADPRVTQVNRTPSPTKESSP